MELQEGRRRSRWLRRASVAALVLVCVLGGVTFAMWPRDDVPDGPDAVVVLGGVGIERAELGIELSDRYDVPLVLSSSAAYFAWFLDVRCDEDVICLNPDPKTTIGEARAVAELAAERRWEHVTVATTRFHTTRSRVLFRQCLGEDRVTVVGAPSGYRRGIMTYLYETVGTLAALTIHRAC